MKHHLRGRGLLVALGLWYGGFACGGSPRDPAASERGEALSSGSEVQAEAFEWGTPVGEDLHVGGQPTSDELEAAAAAGVTTVISLRTDGEPGTEGEQASVEALGMTFVSIPVAGAEGLNEQNARALDEALEQPGTALLHCGSGNRAGSLLGLRAYITEGASGDDALRLALEAGMTRLEEALKGKLLELCQDAPDRCPSTP